MATSDTGYEGISFGWEVDKLIFNNFKFSQEPITFENGKYNYIPLFYFGTYSTSQNQILSLDQNLYGDKLELIFSNNEQNIALMVLGQPFMAVYVPKKCEFYIKVIEKKANSKI